MKPASSPYPLLTVTAPIATTRQRIVGAKDRKVYLAIVPDHHSGQTR